MQPINWHKIRLWIFARHIGPWPLTKLFGSGDHGTTIAREDEAADAQDNVEFPREDRSSSEITDFVRDAHAKVRDIGTGHRWYDHPYKITWAFQRSWLAKRLPQYARTKLNHAINYLFVFYEHDINKAWSRQDPLHSINVPVDDHVQIPGIWVMELFPPSEFATLAASIEKNSWDKQRTWIGLQAANLDMLSQSRTGSGPQWWRLAEIASQNSSYRFPDGLRADLPLSFQAIEMLAVQVGTGLTAVLAYFHLNDTGASAVDKVWHSDHEPQIVFGKGLPRTESRQFTAFRKTQEVRRSLHDEARQWLARSCPGFFARNGEPQPSMDVLLFEKYDPIAMEVSHGLTDALRALGLTEFSVFRYTSSELPGFLLEPPGNEMLLPGLRGEPIWTIWGQQKAAAAHFGSELSAHGGGAHGLADIVFNRSRNLLILVAISQLLSVMNKRLSVRRDEARVRHGRFRAKDLKQLRRTFLTFSMDMTSVQRDIEAFNLGRKVYEGNAEFERRYAPHILKFYEKEDGRVPEPVNINRELIERQRQGFELLVTADRDYREILSTVASLGASVSATRLARAAVVIAIATLAATVATLLIAKIDPDAPLETLGRWIWSLLAR